jgi:hypothetical protein
MLAASVEELGTVPGIGESLAVTIRAALDRLAADVERSVDTRRGRLVAVPLEADEGAHASSDVGGGAADGEEAGEAGDDVDSPESGDYA